MSITWSNDINDTPPPKEFDLNFFQQVVENALRETDVRVCNVHFTRGSSSGENYCSEIYRVAVGYELLPTAIMSTVVIPSDCGKNINKRIERHGVLEVIVKNVLSSEASRFLEDLQVFLKEKIIYYDILPRMQVLLDARDANCRFGPRLYHTMKLPVSSFAFEDLCASGFQMAAREVGLDETHARLVLKRLAQFHALSMYLAKMDSDIMNKPLFHVGMTSSAGLIHEGSMLLKFFGGNAQGLVNLIDTWPGFEAIAKKLHRYTDNLQENIIDAGKRLPNELCVLNHGDLWTNNMLFHYTKNDNGIQEPDDITFVDFQYSVWGSPGLDINYFFYTSLNLDVLKNKREELLHVYHASLSATMQHVGYARNALPTYDAIRREVHQHEAYGFFAQYGITPTVTMSRDHSGDSTLDNLADENFAREKIAQMYQSPRLQEMLRYTLKHFDAEGVWK